MAARVTHQLIMQQAGRKPGTFLWIISISGQGFNAGMVQEKVAALIKHHTVCSMRVSAAKIALQGGTLAGLGAKQMATLLTAASKETPGDTGVHHGAFATGWKHLRRRVRRTTAWDPHERCAWRSSRGKQQHWHGLNKENSGR